MRKSMLLAVAMLLFTACSNDDPTPTEPSWLTETKALLVGTWYGEKHSEVFNTTEAEEIRFEPFATSREVVSLFGTFEAYGLAYMTEFLNGEPWGYSYADGGAIRCYYSLEKGYDCVEVSFYEINADNEVINKADKRELYPVSSTEFVMRPSGTAETMNMTYHKQ